jgi:hypothetical protein
MLKRNKIILTLALLLTFFTFASPAANAKPSEYQLIVKHLKSKYQAKKVSIPMLWLARFAVSIVRPAGVKSFNITLFDGLRISRETLDMEMQRAMRSSMGPEWESLLRVRSREGDQVYMYMREAGKDSVRILLVTIDAKEGAAVIRATISPERLADFINDPKIFGVSLNDTNDKTVEGAEDKPAEPPVLQEKPAN